MVAGTVRGKITASGKYKKYDPVAVDGSEVAANAVILYADTPLLAADQKATIDVRDGAVNGNALTWAIAVDDTQRNAVLAGMAARRLMVDRMSVVLGRGVPVGIDTRGGERKKKKK